ncbi:unnamed protein product [Cuscuta campestris]|uniref:Callose synthase helical domain-containing protein n=1 Tax=Cuscuta campestris TaxID=132261 RepID=A0A484NMA8_9ASTE|nr:unnamed protein product [Cuscuta campestris]
MLLTTNTSRLLDSLSLVGKGRDVGLNQIALFEGKVAGGNGEQVLSRDVYRLGQLFDFFRMLSFYFTTVGYYFCTMIFLAKDTAIEGKEPRLSQEELWDRILRDEYMKYAVQECYYTLKLVLTSVLDTEGKKWVERVYDEIQRSIANRSILVDIELNKLPLRIQKLLHCWEYWKLDTMIMGGRLIQLGEIMMISTSTFGHLIALNLVGHGE